MKKTGLLQGRPEVRVFLFAAFAVAAAGLLSCTSAQKAPQKSNLTPGVIKTALKKGLTSQTEILKLVGSPNIISKNKAGEEVWTYSRQSFDAESGGFAGGLVLFGGGKAFSSSASASFDLIITFDSRNIVKDYSLVSSQF